MKIGLVLEGGAMRGMYTAGILDIFLDHAIPIDVMVGVSAGALFGANYPAKQRGRGVRYNLQFLGDKRYISLHSWLTTGNVVNKDFAYYQVPQTLDPFDNATFQASNIDFYATLTNVATGDAEYHRIHDVFAQMETLRASSALPYFSRLIEVNGQHYLDGSIADSIPFAFAQTLGVDKLIVILTRPAGYRKPPYRQHWLAKLVYRRYPHLIRALAQRNAHYNQQLSQLAELERAGKAFVFRPSETIAINRLEKDPAKVRAMYELGLRDGSAQISALKQWLAHK